MLIERQTKNRLMPTTYFFLAIVGIVAMHLVIPGKRILAFPSTLVGLMPLFAGIGINLLADNAMKRYQTTVKPFEATSALIEDGVFAMTRNPMYLGMVLILAGIAMLLGSVTPWIIVCTCAAVLQKAFIRHEEYKLETVFGEQFRDYKTRVRRWV